MCRSSATASTNRCASGRATCRPARPAEFSREYLTRHIRFELGAEEKRGIEEFAARLRRLGNGPLYPPRYVPLPTR